MAIKATHTTSRLRMERFLNGPSQYSIMDVFDYNLKNLALKHDDIYLISIADSAQSNLFETNSSALSLQFDDYDPNVDKEWTEHCDPVWLDKVTFNNNQAKQIIEFIDRINGIDPDSKDIVFVDCRMGSRAAAISIFIAEYLNLDKHYFVTINRNLKPNMFVLNKLRVNAGLPTDQ